MKISVIDIKKKKVGDVELPSTIYEAPVNGNLLHDVVVNQMANHRRGTSSTKGRHEVRGGGKKPWKQKGLGKARAGSIRSPLFRGGGVIFGPKPRSYAYTIPKKAKRAALASALSLKIKDKAFMVVDKIEMDKPKTSEAAAMLRNLGFEGKSLLVLGKGDKNVELSFRNIPGVKLTLPNRLNVYDLLNANQVLCAQDALAGIQERLS
jgi:large subunit ribosomal protein L4